MMMIYWMDTTCLELFWYKRNKVIPAACEKIHHFISSEATKTATFMSALEPIRQSNLNHANKCLKCILIWVWTTVPSPKKTVCNCSSSPAFRMHSLATNPPSQDTSSVCGSTLSGGQKARPVPLKGGEHWKSQKPPDATSWPRMIRDMRIHEELFCMKKGMKNFSFGVNYDFTMV